MNLRLVLIPVLLANCAEGKKGADFILKCNPLAGLTLQLFWLILVDFKETVSLVFC